MKTVCWPVVEKMVQSAEISYLIEMQPLGTENNITQSYILPNSEGKPLLKSMSTVFILNCTHQYQLN